MKTLTKQTALVTYETGTGAPEQDAWFDEFGTGVQGEWVKICLLYTSPSPRDLSTSRMPSSA